MLLWNGLVYGVPRRKSSKKVGEEMTNQFRSSLCVSVVATASRDRSWLSEIAETPFKGKEDKYYKSVRSLRHTHLEKTRYCKIDYSLLIDEAVLYD